MEKPNAVLSEPSPAAPAVARRPPAFLKKYWDFLAVLLLVLASFPAVWLSPHTVTLVPNLGLIDDNWHLDATFKALRGIWVGRDVAFTHGPIFQWLSSIPARTLPLSVGAIYATWNIVPLWCAVLFSYLTARLLLPEQPSWKRFVFVLLLSAFWETSLRSTLPLLLFAVFLRAWYAVREGRRQSVMIGVTGALLCALAFVVAGDTGIYATAAWLVVFAAIAFETRREKFAGKLLSALLAYAGAWVVIAIVIDSVMASPFNFKFWRDSLAQVAAYRWATPAAMTDQGATHLFAALSIGAAVFLVQAFTRRKDARPITQRTAFLAGGFVYGLAVMQSALVRSDIGHVIIGEFALTFLAGAILFSFEGYASFVGGFAAIAACLIFSQSVLRPSSFTRLFEQLRNPLTECPAGYTEFDRACYQEPLTPQMLTAGGNFLSQHAGAGDSVFVFPYQTMLGLAGRRNVAGGLMQAYTASGPYLSQLELSGLQQTPAAALYFPDGDLSHWSQADVSRWSRNYLSVPVDGVSNFTRAPEVWFWMLHHYRTAEALPPGVVGLQRDDSRVSRITMQTQPLGLPARTYTIAERESTTALGSSNWPAGFDFIRLRMTVHYPVWWKLRKPERLQLEITRADGTRELQWMIVQPNLSTEVWFYPWDAPDLASFFNSDESQWRMISRSPVTSLRLLATPLDWVSQQPDAITIEAADAVKLGLSPQ